MRGALRKIVAALRDAWLIVGLTLLLFLSLEVLYRAQGAARRALRSESTPAAAPGPLAPTHPNAGESWWREIHGGGNPTSGGGTRYDPFRGWWQLPYSSRYINVDAEGRRVTIQSPPTPGPRRLVYLFGGSVMWGWVVRDSFTIPSQVAARLRGLGYSDVEVVNLSQSMFDLAQNLATLLVELRRGRVPAVAVFLDGNNESAPPYQSGELGRVLNEDRIARRFSRRSGLGPELVALLRHSALVRRLTDHEVPRPEANLAALCDTIGGAYSRQLRAIEAIAAAFSFEVVFLWQPLLATTQKPLSEWERGITSGAGWRAMLSRCTAVADSLLADRRGTTFFPLHDLFDRDSTSVFLDDYGHLTERADGIVADYIALRIVERLGPPKQK
jgi:hypothetical protein